MNKYVVIDTNLLVSSALIEGGSSFIGIEFILSSGYELVFSSETFSEFQGVIFRPKFDRYVNREDREEFAERYAKEGHFVIPERHFTHCRDKKDNKFLDVAVAGNVAALISGDKDLLDLKEIEGIPIVTMAGFLAGAH